MNPSEGYVAYLKDLGVSRTNTPQTCATCARFMLPSGICKRLELPLILPGLFTCAEHQEDDRREHGSAGSNT